MLHFMDVTIDCDDDTAKTYEHILGEDTPLKFPLRGCQVTHHGGRAVISRQQVDDRGRATRALIIDRLRAAEPAPAGRGDTTAYTLSGQSEKLYSQGVNPADATVTFTISDWGASAGSVG